MSLRLRLIVAFFLFSVVPLAAVTFYSYTSNVRALQVAAQHETEMLTGELTQRMQVVTTQISERVEHLMDMPATASARRRHRDVGQDRGPGPTQPVVARAKARRRGSRRPAPPRPRPGCASPRRPRAATRRSIRTRSKVRSPPRSARWRCCSTTSRCAASARGRGPGSPRRAGRPAGVRRAAPSRGPRRRDSGLRGWYSSASFVSGRRSLAHGDGRGGGRGVRPGTPVSHAGRGRRRYSWRAPMPPARRPVEACQLVTAGLLDANARRRTSEPDPTHMKVDLAPMRREFSRDGAGRTLEQMTPEERQRVGREVNQRLMGIVPGFS